LDRFCGICRRYCSKTNIHCSKCNRCTTKVGCNVSFDVLLYYCVVVVVAF